jgi:hypothetical protein
MHEPEGMYTPIGEKRYAEKDRLVCIPLACGITMHLTNAEFNQVWESRSFPSMPQPDECSLEEATDADTTTPTVGTDEV